MKLKSYYEPLIKEDDKSFTDNKGKQKNNLKINHVHMLLQLYGLKDNFTENNAIEMIHSEAKKEKEYPNNLNVCSLQISNKYIKSKKTYYSKKEVIEVGVFNHEKANTNELINNKR